MGIVIFGSHTIISSCIQQKDEQTASDDRKQPDPCEDLSMLSKDELEIRTTFEYVNKMPYPDKRRDNRSLWVEAEEGHKCGGCQIMNGPIQPGAYWNAWISNES
jgi:hypothetical protein